MASAIGFLLLSQVAWADRVLYLFDDFDLDEVFNVSVLVEGDSAGLATYNVALTGLDDSPLDPSTFVWTENALSNLGNDFVSRGFTAGLLEGPVGSDGYSAANSQFQQNAIYGVGQRPVFVDAFDRAPNNFDIDLGVPALLGTLTLPGANSLSGRELVDLLTPNAALFVEDGDSGRVELPAEVVIGVGFGIYPNVPEPLLPSLPTPSSVLIDFDGAGGTTSNDGPYLEEGLTMTVTPHPSNGDLGGFIITRSSSLNGSDAVFVDTVGGPDVALTFTAGGSPFSLHSIDFGPDFIFFDIPTDGVVETSTGFRTTAFAGGRQFFSGPDFTNITSFTLSNLVSSPFLAFDNLVVTIAVPEPTTGVLLAAAAFGVAAWRRRC